MRTPTTLTLASMLIAGLALQVQAATLAPSKPSQVITVTGNTNEAPCLFGKADGSIADQHNPDGTVVPFTVPAGLVFVVTSWEWSGTGLASSAVTTTLILVDSTPNVVGALSVSTAPSDGSGNSGGSVVIPSGFVVKSGLSMCYVGAGSFRQVFVHGYFTKDK